jgi:hypothetical protein
MKNWYRAVCFEHKETIDVFVSNPSCTSHYLSDKDKEIQGWLEKHYACRLELVGEQDADRIWNASCWDPIEKLPPSADPDRIKK